MDEIKDIKAPVDLPAELFWLWVGLLGVLLAAGVVLLFLKFRKKGSRQPSLPDLPAWAIALRRLEDLKFKDLPGRGKFKEYYFELTAILRQYIENRFGIRAPEMTTEEFLQKVKAAQDVFKEHKQILIDFLGFCDMVKFAKHVPAVDEDKLGLQLVERFIIDTKEIELNV